MSNNLLDLKTDLSRFLEEEESSGKYSIYFKDKLAGLTIPESFKDYLEFNNQVMINCLKQCVEAIDSVNEVNVHTLSLIYIFYKDDKGDELIKSAKLIKRCFEFIGSCTNNKELLNRGIVFNYAINHH